MIRIEVISVMPNIQLHQWWEAREPTEADDARRLAKFANGLPGFDPIYASWLRAPKAGTDVLSIPLSEADAKQFLIEKMAKYDVGGAWPEAGSFFGAGHAGGRPYDFRKGSYADISGRIGSYGASASKHPNHIFMRLSDIRPSTGRPWRASELRPLMKFARDIWRPAQMCAKFSFYTCPKIADPTWAAGERTLIPRIGWITCLPPDLAARAKCPADVHVETLDDGAALVTLCEEPFDKTDAEGLARLHALEAALRPIQS
jgi:hypothetical protein